MKVKVREASGPVLDWMAAKAEGHELMLFDTLWRNNAALKGYSEQDTEQHLQWQPQRGQQVIVEVRHLQLDQRNPEVLTPTRCAAYIPNYSTDWSQGGQIIERNGISVARVYGDWPHPWCADFHEQRFTHGPTPLVAAMRCYCCSKLGEEVEVPDDLA